MNPNTKNIHFETVYDTYCPILNSVALQICSSEKKANLLLAKTFKIIYKENIVQEKHRAFCVTLIRLIVKTASLKTTEKEYKLKYSNTPVLNHLIFKKNNLENYCTKKNITRAEGIKILKTEFSWMVNNKN